jgi:hypothetical protein
VAAFVAGARQVRRAELVPDTPATIAECVAGRAGSRDLFQVMTGARPAVDGDDVAEPFFPLAVDLAIIV